MRYPMGDHHPIEVIPQEVILSKLSPQGIELLELNIGSHAPAYEFSDQKVTPKKVL